MKQTKKNFSVINVLSFFMCLGFFNNSFSNEEPLKNSIKNNQRLQEHIIRDKYRNPEETLNFFGIKPEMHVLEILPGKGYYTEILAHYLNKKGKLTIANFGEDNKNEYLRSLHINFVNYFKKQDFGKMHIRKFYSEGYLSEIPDNSIDLVLTFRNTHNWINNKSVTAIYKSINRVLKKGGTLGVVQHRANINDDEILSSKKGYVPEKYLIKLIENLNFKFNSRTEVNSNAFDTKNYPEGVWTLPPTFRLKEKDREKYQLIGESDRMTLRFIKK